MFYNGKQHTHTFVISTESQLAKARPTMLYIRLVYSFISAWDAHLGLVLARSSRTIHSTRPPVTIHTLVASASTRVYGCS